jgi:drug/metabolite transporter (DMT)-like permease
MLGNVGVGKLLLLTVLALTAFAANSILCRLALASHEIDPASFTLIRLSSGALVLALIVAVRDRSGPLKHGNWLSALMLFAYAIAFSFAYLGLTAGTGALILFGSVQATMLIVAIATKQNPTPLQWVGLAIALAGLVYLVSPGLAAPPLERALLMSIAGIAWGFYTLLGRGVADPVGATAGNFVRAAPFAFLPIVASRVTLGEAAVWWALLSGAVTSGLGYVIWYAALPGLGATRAAVVQLLVPIIAAAGGVLLLGEVLTTRILIAAALTISGVALAVFAKAAPPARQEASS